MRALKNKRKAKPSDVTHVIVQVLLCALAGNGNCSPYPIVHLSRRESVNRRY